MVIDTEFWLAAIQCYLIVWLVDLGNNNIKQTERSCVTSVHVRKVTCAETMTYLLH